MEPGVNLGQALWRFAQGLDVSTYDAREIARSAADYLHNTASLPASRLVPEQRRGAL
jgi:hypothetical protein